MTSTRALQLCADDFGLSAGIDLAILDLIQRGRLSATSCMMAGPTLPIHADRLKALTGRVDIGLHVTLTDLAPLGPMPVLCPDGMPPALGSLMQKAFLTRLSHSEISAEIGRQIDRFTTLFGQAPDFVDGHQHVHLLPTVRAALLDHFRAGHLPRTTAIRVCSEPVISILRRGIEVSKTLFISALSAGLASSAGNLGIPVNDSFRGVTAFHTDRPFGPTFKRFLVGPGRAPLAMCHPGLAGHPAHETDGIAAARPLEYAYFASDAFVDDLSAAGVMIARRPR